MISVVIPLYNKAQSFPYTLCSVLNQTYNDFEVVVVDDGSTDGSADCVKQYEDSRIRLIRQENKGVSSARNTGIREAKGEYVCFLDADDAWAPDYLSTLVALISDYPDKGLYCLGFKERYKSNDEEITYQRDTYRGVVENPWKTNYRIWTGSVSAKRERILKVGLFDERMSYGEDLDMWWRLILDGGLVIDTSCHAFYNQDTENRAMNKTMPLERHIPYYMDKYDRIRTTNMEFRKYFDEQMVYRIYPYLFDKQYKKEAKRLARKIDYTPLKWSLHFRMIFPHIYRWMTGR